MKRTQIKILFFNCPLLVVISPVGMEDTLVIDIEPICECGCSEEGSEGYDFTSEHCDYHGEETLVIIGINVIISGNLVCGECECFDRPDTGNTDIMMT